MVEVAGLKTDLIMKTWLIVIFALLTLFFVGVPAAFEGRESYIFVKNLTYDSTVFFASFAFFWTCRSWVTAIISLLLWLNLSSDIFFYTDQNLDKAVILLATVIGTIFIIYQKFKGAVNVN